MDIDNVGINVPPADDVYRRTQFLPNEQGGRDEVFEEKYFAPTSVPIDFPNFNFGFANVKECTDKIGDTDICVQLAGIETNTNIMFQNINEILKDNEDTIEHLEEILENIDKDSGESSVQIAQLRAQNDALKKAINYVSGFYGDANEAVTKKRKLGGSDTDMIQLANRLLNDPGYAPLVRYIYNMGQLPRHMDRSYLNEILRLFNIDPNDTNNASRIIRNFGTALQNLELPQEMESFLKQKDFDINKWNNTFSFNNPITKEKVTQLFNQRQAL